MSTERPKVADGESLTQPAPTGGVVVTGASGIGAACSRQLARAGRKVFVLSDDAESCAGLVSELGHCGSGWAAVDLRDEAQAERAFAEAADRLGRIEGVIAVVGGSGRRLGDGWLHEVSLAAWVATLELNLTTTFLTARESVRHMRAAGGSLVLTSSVLASAPHPGGFTTHAYAAAKAAISGWAAPLAAAYAPDGIRVNVVAPGLVLTPMASRAAGSAELRAFAVRKQPIVGGMLAAEDVAHVMCSTLDASTMTGQVIAVDGGWSVTSTS